MQISAVHQEITLNGCVQNCFRSGYNAVATMAKAVQAIASKAFSIATNPFVVSFGTGGSLALSYATSFSVAKSFMLFTGSFFAGLGATIAASYLYAKLFSGTLCRSYGQRELFDAFCRCIIF